jgi:hypothetical protein
MRKRKILKEKVENINNIPKKRKSTLDEEKSIKHVQILTSISSLLNSERSEWKPFDFSFRKDCIKFIIKRNEGLGWNRETAYIAILFLDRYLNKAKVCMKRKFYLVALACLFIAGKLEEEDLEPTCDDMLKDSKFCILDYEIKHHEIRNMERNILSVIQWDLSYCSPYFYFYEFISVLEIDRQFVSFLELFFDKAIEMLLLNHEKTFFYSPSVHQ